MPKDIGAKQLRLPFGKPPLSVKKGTEGPVIPLKRDHSHYRDVAAELLQLQETEELDMEDGQKKPFIRDGNLVEAFRMMKKQPGDYQGVLIRLGFLRKKTTEPTGWYICLEEFQDGEFVVLTTRQLRKLAQKLWKRPECDNILPCDDDFPIKTIPLKEIQVLLNRWQRNPDEVIPQLLAKNYLVQFPDRADTYYVCRTQKEGREL